jgi:outer membrane protein assembly factor BamD
MRLPSLLVLVMLAALISSCASKSAIKPGDTVDVAFSKSKALYEKGRYGEAARAFETVLSLGRGSEIAQESQYLLAESYYKNKEYLIAASEYRRYVTFHPRSERRENAEFMEALSYYKMSPRYKLDQTDTDRAITLFRIFIGKYPSSDRVTEAASYLDEMRLKLAKKSFTSATMYFKLRMYVSAAMYFQITIDNYPETAFAEESLALQIQAYTLYADMSVPEKQAERYQMAIDSYQKYLQLFPNGKNRALAESYHATASRLLSNLNSSVSQN